MHAYFACPVAQKVVAEVAAELHGEWGLLGWDLTPTNIWLAQPPRASVHQGVWDVVCLAALNAIKKAHSMMYLRCWNAGGSAWPGADNAGWPLCGRWLLETSGRLLWAQHGSRQVAHGGTCGAPLCVVGCAGGAVARAACRRRAG